jgi:hypothetical protein
MSTSIIRSFNSSMVSLRTAVDSSRTARSLFRSLLFVLSILSLVMVGVGEVGATEPSSDAKVFQFQGPDNLKITGTLSSPSYENGDTAMVSLVMSVSGKPPQGLSNTTLVTKITDEGIECSGLQIVSLSDEEKIQLSFPITATCPNPTLALTFFDEKGAPLDPTVLNSTADVSSGNTDPLLGEQVPDVPPSPEGVSNTTKLIIVLTTLSALVLLLALIRIRRSSLLVVIIACIFGYGSMLPVTHAAPEPSAQKDVVAGFAEQVAKLPPSEKETRPLGSPIASMSITNLEIKDQKENVFTIVFDISNELSGVQSNVIYAVNVRAVDGVSLVNQRVFEDDPLHIVGGNTVHKEIVYTAPAFLNGQYIIEVEAKNTNGLTLTQAQSQVIPFLGTGEGVSIDTESCYVSIEGMNNKNNLTQGLDITENETLLLHCSVQNTGKASITIVPTLQTRYRSTHGEVVSTEKQTPLTVSGGETVTYSVKIPKMTRPQSYNVALYFVNTDASVVSNQINAHYVLQGLGATINNATLDKDSYVKGEVAKLAIIWSGPAGNFPDARAAGIALPQGTSLRVSVMNDKGQSCINEFSKPLDTTTGGGTENLEVPMVEDCVNPSVLIKIVDASNTVLAENSFTLQSANVTTAPITTNTNTSMYTYSIVAGVAILLLLFLAFFLKKRGLLATRILPLLIVGIGLFGVGGEVSAKTDTYNLPPIPYQSYGGTSGNVDVSFSVTLDKVVVAPGERITASALSRLNACANTFGSGISVTAPEINNNNETFVLGGEWVKDNPNQPIDPNHSIWTVNSAPVTFNAPMMPGVYKVTFKGYYSVFDTGWGNMRSWLGNMSNVGNNTRFGAIYHAGNADMFYTVLPAAPATFTATPGACGTGEVKFDWSAVPGATGYEGEMDNLGVWRDLGNVTTFTLGGHAVASQHTYKIRAKSANGPGEPKVSNPVVVVASYGCFTATPDTCGKINLNWDAGQGAQFYELSVNGGQKKNIGNTTSWFHNIGDPQFGYDYVPGKTYTYRINAWKLGGRFDERNSTPVSVIAPPACVAVPAQPASVTATPGVCDTNKIDVNWSSVAGATSYEIQIDGVGQWIDKGMNLTHSHTSLQPGSSHTYNVRARNVSGPGQARASNPSPVTAPQACVAQAFSCTGSVPANATMFAGDNLNLVANTAYSYSANDTAPKCQYRCDNTFNWNGSACVAQAQVFSCTGNVPQNATMFAGDNLNLVANTAYSYSANDTAPKCQYRCDNTFNWNGSACVANPPAQPTVTATPGACDSRRIDVSWTAVAGATKYELRVNNGIWLDLGLNRNTAFNNLNAGDRFTYEVRAVDLSGPGTPGSSGQVVAPPACGPNNITAPNCTIQRGAGTCDTTVTWNSNLLAAPRVTENNVQIAANANGNVLRTLSDGTYTYKLLDGAVQKATVDTTASCALGTQWDGNSCECALGTRWDGNSCKGPTVTFDVCDNAGNNCAPSKNNIPGNTPLLLKWTSNGTKCEAKAGNGFATGGRVNGSDGIVASALPGNETFTIVCSYDDNLPNATQKNVTVSTQALVPTINASPKTVPPRGISTLTWDTAGQAGCTLTGGNGKNKNGDPLDASQAGFGTDQVFVSGRTTYKLDCPVGQDATVVVDVTPQGYET